MIIIPIDKKYKEIQINILWTMLITNKRRKNKTKPGVPILIFKIQLFTVAHHSYNPEYSLAIKRGDFALFHGKVAEKNILKI